MSAAKLPPDWVLETYRTELYEALRALFDLFDDRSNDEKLRAWTAARALLSKIESEAT